MMQTKHRPWFVAGALASAALMMSSCGSAGTQPVESGAPATKTTVKSQEGAPASWELLNADEVTAKSTTLRIGVERGTCAGGFTGKVLQPQIQVEATRIVIRTDVEAIKDGVYTCQSNEVVPYTVELPAAVGNHELFDSFCLDSNNLRMSMCADGGVRWRP
jgi:hypothetical protein